MREYRCCTLPILAGLVAGALATAASAQETGTVRGAVTFTASDEPVHDAVVLVVGPSLVALTDAGVHHGLLEVPAGLCEVRAQREHLTAARQTVTACGVGLTFAGRPVLPARSRHLAPTRASGIFMVRLFA